MIRSPNLHGRAPGFTLLDLLIAVAVLAVIVAFVVPGASSDDRLRLDAAARLLRSDIEYAQVMSISDPERPVLVQFYVAQNRYILAYASNPDTPITRPDTGEPYDVRMGLGRAEAAKGVTMQLLNVVNSIDFASHGGLTDFTKTPRIILRIQGKDYPRIVLDVMPTTGSVVETYQAS